VRILAAYIGGPDLSLAEPSFVIELPRECKSVSHFWVMLRNRLYYRAKPFIPSFIRTAVRRKLVLRLRDKVEDIWPIMPGSERPPAERRRWPGDKKFALVLTHDVETASGLAKTRRLMELELKWGFRSSFNFVPESDYRVPRELRETLTQNGFEVGIHDLKHDGRLYQSAREFTKRAARINRYLAEWQAVGFRSAFMLRKLEWLHQLDIQYDASTFDTDPFEPQPEGYQTIFPVWIPYSDDCRSKPHSRNSDSSRSRSFADGYVELPYTLPQDSTLFVFLREQTPEIWFRKLDWIAEHGGMALVITHPDYMNMNSSGRKAGEYPVELYEQLLKYIRDKYAGAYWPALPREVATYVREAVSEPEPSPNGATPQLVSGSGRPDVSQSAIYGDMKHSKRWRLRGKRAAVLLFSYYPADPRPRRAAEALAMEGVTIDLLCLRKDEEEPQREIINGVNVFRLPVRRRRRGKIRYVGQYSAFILRAFLHLSLRSLIRRYDFVHVHNMPDVLVFSGLIPKLLGAKVVLDLHDPMPELMETIFELSKASFSVRLLKRLEKWSIRFADLVLTVNLACKKIYTSRGCPSEKIKVILNSPEDDLFCFKSPRSGIGNGDEPGKPFVILYHGSLVPRNGFDLAVDALETAKRSIPGAKLMVCGERSPFFEGVMDSAQKRGLRDAVQYLGVKNRRQIVEAINSCDLGVIPNHRNTFTEINTPTRIFEYLALGKPVIAPQTQGIKDYFGEGDLIFFEVGDAKDLARKIEFAFSNPDEVKEIIDRGQQVYLAHTWSRQKDHLLNSISGLL
jgi:glycosyltransferase involved in cell wall biosynthesis